MTVKELQPLVRETLADQVFRVMVRHIWQTGLEVGERLPSERSFCEVLEVSRTVVRSALQRLADDGIIEKRLGSGMILRRRPPNPFVLEGFEPELTSLTLEDLYRARIALEVGAIEWSVQGITESDLQKLEELVDAIKERVDAKEPITDEDRAFHRILINASNSPGIIQLASVIEQYFSQMRTFRAEHSSHRPNLDKMDVRHRMIVTALRTRDVEACRHALRLHFLPWPGGPDSTTPG